jgi:hypothetical protein
MVPPKSGIIKKSAVEKKNIVYWSPHKNKQTPVIRLKQTPVPPLEKNGPNAPKKKKLKKKNQRVKDRSPPP